MNKVLEEAKELKKIEIEQKNLEDEIRKYNSNMYQLQRNIEKVEEEINLIKSNIRKSTLSRIMESLHLGKNFELKENLDAKLIELENLRKESDDLNTRLEQLNEKNKIDLEILKNNDIQNYVKLADDDVVITDYDSKSIPVPSVNFNDVPDSKKVIVHSTSLFPRNHTILSSYDGLKMERIIIVYRGMESKKIPTYAHRHDVHFTINAKVSNTSEGFGNWDNDNIMVIDQYINHENEFERISPSDSWTENSVRLSENAIIMIRIQDKDKLPISKEELHNYNVVYYDGEPSECLKNFLSMSNYPIVHTDANDPIHIHTMRARIEELDMIRDAAINYLKNITTNPHDPIYLSEEEMLMVTDIVINTCSDVNKIIPGQHVDINTIDKIVDSMVSRVEVDDKTDFNKIVAFVMMSGLTATKDGKYTFKSDEEVLSTYKIIEKNPEKFIDFLDIKLAYSLYLKHQKLSKKLDTMTPEQIEKFISQYNHKPATENIELEENSSKRR